MKKILTGILLVLLAIGGVVPSVAVQASLEKVKVIIGFNDHAESAVKNVNGKILKKYKNINVVTANIPAKNVETLKNNKNILFIEQDIKVHTNVQTQDWGINKVSAPVAWSNGFTGKGIKIGVIDTGIASHEDILVSGGVSVVDYTTQYEDDQGHGTHVAGIISSENNEIGNVGIAPDSEVYSIKALDSNGSGNLSDIINGIDWAITNDMDIINMSLGTNTDASSLKLAVDTAYQNGVLVVAAAGNDARKNGSGDTVDYPARYESVIAVGATTQDDRRAYFSSTGSTVEVSAPGTDIYSTYLYNSYQVLSGTSMATPYVAGMAALLMEENPTLTHTQIRKLLQQNTKDLGVVGRDFVFGYGFIQAQTIGYETTDVPAAPTNFTVVSQSTTSVELSWSGNSDADSYQLKRDGVVVYEGLNTSHVDNSLQTGTSYLYEVVAVNEFGSSNSVSLTVTTDSGSTKKGQGNTKSK